MATSASKRSPYKQRRIDAMLNEGAADPPPLPASPALPSLQAARSSSPASRVLRVQSSSPDRARILLIAVGSAVILLCASLVLFLLFRQSQPSIPEAHTTAKPVPAPKSNPTPTPARTAAAIPTPAPVASPAKEVPKQQEFPQEPVEFRIKRSKTFEKVGPIRLRLLRANTRWNTCDLYVISGGPAYQKQAHLNKPVPLELSNGSAELVVTSIKSDLVSGSVQQK